jgi:hypothetical protein
MTEFIWWSLFSIVLLIIFYGLLKDLNTLIMKKYWSYFNHLSLKEVYEQGEETELRLLREMSEELRKEKESIQKGVKISDYSSLKQLKERFENQLIELKQKKNGNSSKQIKYVEDWISKLNTEIKKIQ